MEGIEVFRVETSLEDRDTLHDYVTGRRIHLPNSGKWQPKHFRGLGCKADVPKEDRHRRRLVLLMDSAIQDKGVMERRVNVDGMDTSSHDATQVIGSIEDIIFGVDVGDNEPEASLPVRVLPVYKRGDVLKGQVTLKLKKALTAQRVKVQLLGRVVTKKGTIASCPVTCGITGKESIVDEELVLWERMNLPTSSRRRKNRVSDFSSIADLIRADDSIHGGMPRGAVLAPGYHKFNFEFTIPERCFQSLPPMTDNSTSCAYVMYRLKATIDKGRHFRRDNIVAHKGIWVDGDRLDSNRDTLLHDDSLYQAVTVEKTFAAGASCFCTQGDVHVRASLPSCGFVRGDPIPVSLEVENQSRQDIMQVSASIVMKGKGRTSRHRLSLPVSFSAASKEVASDAPITPGTSPCFHWELPWVFSTSSVDSILMPVESLDTGTLVKMNYFVEVTLKRSGIQTKSRMLIPITILHRDSWGYCSGDSSVQ